jgi:hypothetical protein
MRRTLLIAFVLAVFSASSANGLQASSAKQRKSSAFATTSHKSVAAPRKRARKPATGVAGQALNHAPNRAPKRQAGHATRHESVENAAAGKPTPGSDAHLASHQRSSRATRAANSRSSAKFRSKANFRRVAYSYPVRKLPSAAKPYESKETPVASRSSAVEIGRPVASAAGGSAVVAAANADVTETANSAVDEPARPSAAEAVALRNTLKTMPPPLRGSLESLVRQNEKTEEDNLERIEDDSDLNDRIARGMLVPVPVSTTLTINGKLPGNRRYCRPWTAKFLTEIGRAHAAAFHRPLEVSSAVRTVAYQKQLERINGNATAAEGDIASPHLTGAAIDIAKQGMTRQEIGWMRAWLLPLENAGMIDVEEEFRQSCFHITVYKSYAPPGSPLKKAVRTTAAQSIADKSEL